MLEIATLVLGFTGGYLAITCTKAVKQTYMCWHRSGKINAYIVMVWLELTSGFLLSLLSWLSLTNHIGSR